MMSVDCRNDHNFPSDENLLSQRGIVTVPVPQFDKREAVKNKIDNKLLIIINII